MHCVTPPMELPPMFKNWDEDLVRRRRDTFMQGVYGHIHSNDHGKLQRKRKFKFREISMFVGSMQVKNCLNNVSIFTQHSLLIS